MKTVIATVMVPFIRGGAEFHATNLKAALENAGHQAEIVTVPFKDYPPERIPEHILACRLFDLSESFGNKIDLLIGLKFPAYYFRHPNKVLWILHQHRQAYELWGTEYTNLHHSSQGVQVREAIIKADNFYLKEAKKIFTNSQNVSNRLYNFNQVHSTPLYHPPPGKNRFYCHSYENFIFYPSRLNNIKRQHLAIEAMRFVNNQVSLYLAGDADNPAYLNHLKTLIQKHKISDRIKLLNFISEEEKQELYSRCRAVLFIPYDEDYGYITLEAFYSRKAVITCRDSGGPLEFVENGETGYNCVPEPQKLASAIDALAGSEELARKMGQRAFEKISLMNISWDNVVKELTSL